MISLQISFTNPETALAPSTSFEENPIANFALIFDAMFASWVGEIPRVPQSVSNGEMGLLLVKSWSISTKPSKTL